MRIFRNHSPVLNNPKTKKLAGVGKNKQNHLNQRAIKSLSESDIREKVEKLKERKKVNKALKDSQTKKEPGQVSQYMNGGILQGTKNKNLAQTGISQSSSSPNTEDYVLPSDISSNDPNDSLTREKLKGALSGNSFNFSEKEREVLSKILGDE